MKVAARDFFFLPLSSADKMANADFGKLAPRLQEDGEQVEIAILDCFDLSLQAAGMLLIRAGRQLELFGPGGMHLTQRDSQRAGFVAELPDGALKDALSPVSPLRCLLEIGTGRMQAATLSLVDKEQKTHAKAHLYKIMSGKAGGLIISVQGLRGYDKAQRRLRAAMGAAGAVPLVLDGLYTRLFPKRPYYVAKPPVSFAQDAPARDAASAILTAYLPVARANEPGVIGDLDTEFLHDYRIALRKIRSVLSSFKGVYEAETAMALKQRFSDLMAQTGRLRDLDVYLLEEDRYFALLPTTLHGGLRQMFDIFAAERAAEHKQLSRHLRSKAYRAEINALEKLLARPARLAPGPNAQRPVQEFACALIWKRYRKICRIAARISPNTNDLKVHELRIHCKRLRYLLEFFAPVFPKSAFRQLIKPLKRLQDNLGYFNDYSVQQDSLRAFMAGLEGEAEIELAQSVGALIATLHQRQHSERAKVIDNFARFNNPEIQTLFRTLFHARKETA